MHHDFIHWNPLLVAWFNFSIILAKHDSPESRKREIEEIAEKIVLIESLWGYWMFNSLVHAVSAWKHPELVNQHATAPVSNES